MTKQLSIVAAALFAAVVTAAHAAAPAEESSVMTAEAREFLQSYESKLAELATRSALAAWQAACTGREERIPLRVVIQPR